MDEIIDWFDVSPARHEEFRRLLVVFFFGIGLAFPMGIFPEILRGQQRIRLANYLITASLVIRMMLIWCALHFHWGFMPIMLIALGTSLAPDFIAAPLALKKMPAVRLSPRLFSRAAIGDTAKFSLFAYIGTATNLILAKTDQLVLSLGISVAAVALYQAGAKVAEVFRDFTRQLQDTLSPAAAHLHAGGFVDELRHLMRHSTRWSLIISTPLGLLCAFYVEELLGLLTGDGALSRETVVVAYVMLAWHYTSIITHSVSKRIFVMTGHERPLMWLGTGEAVANLLLSIGLVLWWKNVLAVAVGSLLPCLWFGWVHMWPWMARDCGTSGWKLFLETVWPAWLGSVPMLAVLFALKMVVLAPGGNSLVAMFAESALATAVGAAGLWIFCLNAEERDSLRRKFGRFNPGRRPLATQS